MLALAFCAHGWAATGSAGGIELTDAEKSFLDAVAASDMAETQLSKAALAKSSTSAVLNLAQEIADDHSANYQTLVALCGDKKYAIAPQLDERHRILLLKLQSTDSADAVNRIYLDAIATDQSDLDSVLERISGNSNDSDISRFAADTLATVKKHEEVARNLASK
jgi:predicted outer membrane protein